MVEQFINKIKNCRRVATCYAKLAMTYVGFVQLASILTLPLNVHTTHFGLGENLGAPYQLIGGDGTKLSGGGNIFSNSS